VLADFRLKEAFSLPITQEVIVNLPILTFKSSIDSQPKALHSSLDRSPSSWIPVQITDIATMTDAEETATKRDLPSNDAEPNTDGKTLKHVLTLLLYTPLKSGIISF
jgi:hypothetical protein